MHIGHKVCICKVYIDSKHLKWYDFIEKIRGSVQMHKNQIAQHMDTGEKKEELHEKCVIACCR